MEEIKQTQISPYPEIPSGETCSQIQPLNKIQTLEIQVKTLSFISSNNSQDDIDLTIISQSKTNQNESTQDHLKHQGASIWNVAANITKSGMGLGLLFMPDAFKQCGIYIPVIFLLIVGSVCFYCWNLLGISLRKLESDKTYHESPLYQKYCHNLTLETSLAIICGQKWRLFAQIMNALNLVGSSIVYVIFITSQLKDKGVHFLFSVLGIGLIFFSMCFIKSIKAYGKFSIFGLVVYFSVLIFIIVTSAIEINNQTNQEQEINIGNWEAVPNFIGVFILLYDINGTVGIAHASMEKKSKFWISLIIYLVTSCLLSIFIGLIAYLGFREKTKPFIFKSIGSYNYVNESFLGLYCLTLVIGICLYGFVVTQMIDNIFINATSPSDNDDIKKITFKKQLSIKISVRICYFLLITIIAYYFPNANKLFNVIGCITGVSMTYVLPCLLYEKMQNSSKFTKTRICNISIAIIGIISGIIGLVYSMIQIIQQLQK